MPHPRLGGGIFWWAFAQPTNLSHLAMIAWRPDPSTPSPGIRGCAMLNIKLPSSVLCMEQSIRGGCFSV
eukprot:644703-Amphidinium_carterae.1